MNNNKGVVMRVFNTYASEAIQMLSSMNPQTQVAIQSFSFFESKIIPELSHWKNKNNKESIVYHSYESLQNKDRLLLESFLEKIQFLIQEKKMYGKNRVKITVPDSIYCEIMNAWETQHGVNSAQIVRCFDYETTICLSWAN
jgi:hypothetical protein